MTVKASTAIGQYGTHCNAMRLSFQHSEVDGWIVVARHFRRINILKHRGGSTISRISDQGSYTVFIC